MVAMLVCGSWLAESCCVVMAYISLVVQYEDVSASCQAYLELVTDECSTCFKPLSRNHDTRLFPHSLQRSCGAEIWFAEQNGTEERYRDAKPRPVLKVQPDNTCLEMSVPFWDVERRSSEELQNSRNRASTGFTTTTSTKHNF